MGTYQAPTLPRIGGNTFGSGYDQQNYMKNLPGVNGGNNGGGMDLGGVFGSMGGLEGIGKGVGIFGDLYSMYNQNKAMDMSQQMMDNQAKTSNYNMAANTGFTNATADVFGSAQPRLQNQFATTG